LSAYAVVIFKSKPSQLDAEPKKIAFLALKYFNNLFGRIILALDSMHRKPFIISRNFAFRVMGAHLNSNMHLITLVNNKI